MDSSFSYGSADTATSRIFQITFVRGAYSYTVFRDTSLEDDTAEKGVHVSQRTGGTDTKILCERDVVDENFSEMTKLSCNADEVVGCVNERKGDWLIPSQ